MKRDQAAFASSTTLEVGNELRVLVTGAGGFLGSWVARTLAHRGCSVRALLRRANRNHDLQSVELVELVSGDVLDESSLCRALEGTQVVVHCAARVSLKPRDRDELYRTNVTGTLNVLQAASERRIRVIYTSTTGTIGPTREPCALNEDAPAIALPFDYPYADSKRRAEELALSFARLGNDVVVLNPGIILGPGDVHYASTELIRRYLAGEPALHLSGGGSFCDVRDVADAYASAIENGRSGERYILAGANRSYAEIMRQLQTLSGLGHSRLVPSLVAEWGGYLSELQGLLSAHPFESLNVSVVRWGSLFNYCLSDKAEHELGYQRRPLLQTLADTIVDHLSRGAAQVRTAELRELLARANAGRVGDNARTPS